MVDLLTNAGATVAVTGTDTLVVTRMVAQDIAAVLVRGGVAFTEIGQHRASLEEVYMDVTREHATFTAPLDDETVWP